MKFIHFGCWNENMCNPDEDPSKNGVSAVVKSLLREKDPAIKFYIVAGDNYYPHEENGDKIFDYDNFKSGFDCLSQINKKNKRPIYLLMGNHDLVHKKAIKYKDTDRNIPRCHVLEKQLSYIMNKQEKDDLNGINVDMMHYCIKKHQTIILFLNTTLYEKDITDERSTLHCQQLYRKSNFPKSELENLESLMDFEEQLLMLLVTQCQKEDMRFKNVILVGHHPIYTVKYKEKAEQRVKTSSFSYRGLKFLDRLLSMFNEDVKKYYLCADIHHYQLGDLQLNNHNITQIVVGTGGTYCDEINTDVVGIDRNFQDIKLSNDIGPNVDVSTLDEDKKVSLNLTVRDIQASFGYLVCEISDESNDFSYQFKPAMDCQYDKKNKKKDKPTSGGKKIRLKTKTNTKTNTNTKTYKKRKSFSRSKKRTQ